MVRSFNIDYQLFTSFVLIVKLSKSKTHHHTVHVKIVPNDLIEKTRIFPSILQFFNAYMAICNNAWIYNKYIKVMIHVLYIDCMHWLSDWLNPYISFYM